MDFRRLLSINCHTEATIPVYTAQGVQKLSVEEKVKETENPGMGERLLIM